MFEKANILVTGGAGTLGNAIAKRRKQDKWTGKLTVYSTDAHKHGIMKQKYPDVNFIQGDIRNPDTLYNAMAGHNIVVHAAAVKVIPVSEMCSIDTFDVNVNGSQCVCSTALRAGIEHVVGISTDKACHAVNAYGATKYLMEKMLQEYSRQDFETQFHLVRFGNVLESNGSVIEVWKRAFKNGEQILITDPEMTRFWLSPGQAVQYILDAVEIPSGCIYIPKVPKLSLGKLAVYTVGDRTGEARFSTVPVRPGEKKHETLLTEEEGWYASNWAENGYILRPTTDDRNDYPYPSYSSDLAPELTHDELIELLDNG
jgi:FlaA1/EpsC-like NDP-sugar epimerase